jgi:tetratricopeptide (TPR) repeat protein
MSAADKNPLLRQIFEEAAHDMASPTPESNVPHLIDNDDLLTRWSLDQLRSQEHDEIVQHLSTCGRCRSEVATLVKEGVLDLPAREEAPAPRRNVVPAVEQPLPPRFLSIRTVGWGAAILAAAAAVVIAIIVWQPKGQFQSSPDLAKARTELESGKAQEARQRLADLLDSKSLSSSDRKTAMELFEKASVAQAEIELAAANFGNVAKIERDAEARGVKSARLTNMKIQADRNMTVQVAMANKGSLLDYEYGLDGNSFGKGIPVPDERIERVGRELKDAVAQHPDDIDLLLNRGQFLLERGQYQSAHEAFLAAYHINPKNILAILGMGLAHFALEQEQSALERFDEVLNIDRNNLLANLNKAICLERLKRHQEAVPYFKEALKLTSDEKLKEKLDRFLTQNP